ncbi:MAG TPA: D-alanyl-D-alanine carboxypeptidase family protein [Bacillota bacterium]|nr:D-alanyl-D-alanine carboxypeptidase family protein [Bacillota bacterium]
MTAEAAVLMDDVTGQLLYEKNGRKKRPPASTTKIMTALLAVEGGDLRQYVTISQNASSVGEASIELRSGEKLTLEDLVYGAMLQSGNDACVAIAEHIAGTEQNFVLLMNQKAKMLGAVDTSFKNTNGLPQAGHYTTAADLAVITRYALRNQSLKKIVGTKGKSIGTQGERYLNNTNRLLWSYEWADGVKTGTTSEAGNCLVASATKEGRRLISVVLNSEDRWSDSIKLLNYGFNNFECIKIVSEGEDLGRVKVEKGAVKEVKAVASADMYSVVHKERLQSVERKVHLKREVTAPVQKGQQLGLIGVFVGGVPVGSVSIVADRNINKKHIFQQFLNNLLEKQRN